jgi:hypothetical protein
MVTQISLQSLNHKLFLLFLKVVPSLKTNQQSPGWCFSNFFRLRHANPPIFYDTFKFEKRKICGKSTLNKLGQMWGKTQYTVEAA